MVKKHGPAAPRMRGRAAANSASSRIVRTMARRRSGKFSLVSLMVRLPEGLAADDALRNQHGGRDAALEREPRRLLDRLADARRLVDRVDQGPRQAQRLAAILPH